MMSNHHLGLNISQQQLYFSACIQLDAQFKHVFHFYKLTSNLIMTQVRNIYLSYISVHQTYKQEDAYTITIMVLHIFCNAIIQNLRALCLQLIHKTEVNQKIVVSLYKQKYLYQLTTLVLQDRKIMQVVQYVRTVHQTQDEDYNIL